MDARAQAAPAKKEADALRRPLSTQTTKLTLAFRRLTRLAEIEAALLLLPIPTTLNKTRSFQFCSKISQTIGVSLLLR
jgi:hypothetical protein